MVTSIVLKALDNVVINQEPDKGLIIHSNIGSQYTSKEFKLSFIAKGCPYGNVCIGSFYVILKKEYVYLNTFIDCKHARLMLFQYIEGFYNRKISHSSINYMTPDNFEQICRAV